MNSIWTDYSRNQFITTLAETAQSMAHSVGATSHKYFMYSSDGIHTTYDKRLACSFRTMLSAVEELSSSSLRLAGKDLASLKKSFVIITNRFEHKEAHWFYKLPIISCIYNSIKGSLVDRARKAIDELDRSHKRKFSDVFGHDKIVENAEQAIERMKQSESGQYCVWKTPEGALGCLAKPLFGMPSLGDAIVSADADFGAFAKLIDAKVGKQAQLNWFHKEGTKAKSGHEAIDQLFEAKPGSYRVAERAIYLRLPALTKSESYEMVRVADNYFGTLHELLQPIQHVKILETRKLYLPNATISSATALLRKNLQQTYLLIKDPDNRERFLFVRRIPTFNGVKFYKKSICPKEPLFQTIQDHLQRSQAEIEKTTLEENANFIEKHKERISQGALEAIDQLKQAPAGYWRLWKCSRGYYFLQKRPLEPISSQQARLISSQQLLSEQVKLFTNDQAVINYLSEKKLYKPGVRQFSNRTVPGSVQVFDDLDRTTGRHNGFTVAMMLPSWKADKSLSMKIESTDDFFEKFGAFLLLKENPLELLRQGNIYYPDLVVKPNEAMPQEVRQLKTEDYLLTAHATDPKKLRFVQMFRDASYGEVVKNVAIEKNDEIIKQIDDLIRESQTFHLKKAASKHELRFA